MKTEREEQQLTAAEAKAELEALVDYKFEMNDDRLPGGVTPEEEASICMSNAEEFTDFVLIHHPVVARDFLDVNYDLVVEYVLERGDRAWV